ncbi:hypothetical protein Zmor_019707 [Zophobas morio]|uniref:Uncharacterized protein n=1 Tax=Zophobas morio TaxID=2755281 RepID=A0AA38I2F9_9CUCU|nr:hypothetical protein Zmor_019707 [Zophobas morio]
MHFLGEQSGNKLKALDDAAGMIGKRGATEIGCLLHFSGHRGPADCNRLSGNECSKHCSYGICECFCAAELSHHPRSFLCCYRAWAALKD